MMYFIGLQLKGTPEEYANLYNAIQALGSWSNRLENTWIVQSRFSASRIRDLLKTHLKPQDRLFVGQFVKNWAGTGMGEGFPEWLNRRAFSLDETERLPPQQGQ